MKKLVRIVVTGIAMAVVVLMSTPAYAGPGCRGEWLKLNGSANLLNSGWPSAGAYTPGFLSLGGNQSLITTGTDASGNNIWWMCGGDDTLYYTKYAYSTDTFGSWTQATYGSGPFPATCGPTTSGGATTELLSLGVTAVGNGDSPWTIYQPAEVGHDVFPAAIVYQKSGGGIGEFSNSGTTTVTATGFTIDPNGYPYAVGLDGACTPSGLPGGKCITFSTNGGSSWSTMTGSPGAEQVASDLVSSIPILYALGDLHRVWWITSGGWTKLTDTICYGGGTLSADQITANNGTVWAIADNSGSAGEVYSFVLGYSSCWKQESTFGEGTLELLSISASLTQAWDTVYGGSVPGAFTANILGVDASGNLWGLCY
jgi:hypothetical protein